MLITYKLHTCIGLFFFVFLQCNVLFGQSNYSFLVAGHSYGAHTGENIGLHPPFLSKMEDLSFDSIEFLFLTGDIVNKSNTESWQQVEEELEDFDVSSFYVMGNHDQNDFGQEAFMQKHGGSYYSFSFNAELFIVLNSTLEQRSISDEQITFLRQKLDSIGSDIENVFVFFHEILWNSRERYMGVLSNSRSRYDQIKDFSNYWEEVHPILVESSRSVFVIAGDVAGNADAIPAFYDKCDNVKLIASGMGEVEEENFLKVNMSSDTVIFELIALRDGIETETLEFYSIPKKADSIYGDTVVGFGTYMYNVNEIYNADTYWWEFNDSLIGSSQINFVDVFFTEGFSEAFLKVRSQHYGFGYSDYTELKVVEDLSNAYSNISVGFFEEDLVWYQVGENLHVKLSEVVNNECQLALYTLSGKCVLVNKSKCIANELVLCGVGVCVGSYILELTDGEKHLFTKIFLE